MKLNRDILAEQIRITRLLLIENRLDFILTKYGPKLADRDFQRTFTDQDRLQIVQHAVDAGWSAWPDAGEKFMYEQTKDEMGRMVTPRWFKPQVVLNYVTAFDPSAKKLYTQWLVTLLVKSQLYMEDLSKATSYLQVFERFKGRLPAEQRDINRYKTITELYDVVQPFEEEQTQGEIDREYDMKMRQESKVLLNTPEYKIVVPLTKEASCYYGRNTQWCTAATSTHNYFDSYNRQGPLYIILHKPSNTRWQFHMATGQFMDERDHPYNKNAFINEHPVVAEFFDKISLEGLDWVNNHDGWIWTWNSETNVLLRVTGTGLNMKGEDSIQFSKDAEMTMTEVHIDDDRMPDDTFVASLIESLNRVGPIKANNPDLLSKKIICVGDTWGKVGQIGEHLGNTIWRKAIVNVAERRAYYNGEYVEAGSTTIYGCENDFMDAFFMERKGKLSLEDSDISKGDEEHAATIFAELSPYLPENIMWPRRPADDWEPFDDMAKELKELVLKRRPGVGRPGDIYDLQGDSPLAREAILEFLRSEIDETIDQVSFGYVVKEFSNTIDLFDAYGSRDAKQAAGYAFGDDHFEVYEPHMDDDRMEELLDSLKPEKLLVVGLYMQENYADEIENIFGEENEEDDFDPTSSSHIVKLQNEVDDDDLDTAFRHAAMSGEETGAVSEIYDACMEELKQHPEFHWHNGKMKTHEKSNTKIKDRDWSNFGQDMIHDELVVVAMSVQQAAALTKDASNVEFVRDDSDGWKEYLGLEIDIDAPYYGWQGYDEDAAAETFDMELYDKEIITNEKLAALKPAA